MIFNKKANNLKTIAIEEEIYLQLKLKSLQEDKDFSEILRELLEK